MEFGGLQKLTLLDFPEKVACTVFTKGCNFRCPFCHNAALVTHIDEYTVSEEEVLSFLKKRNGMIDGLVITGGEPLLYGEIGAFIKKVKDLGLLVKLDTNGSRPELLGELIEKGLLDYVAMDIKNCKEKYEETCGVSVSISDIEKSIDTLRKSGVPFEFRTTVSSELHSVSDIASLAKWIGGEQKYYLQNFVDSGDTIEGGLSPVSAENLEKMRVEAAKYIKNTFIRGK
jgi:pyruvate formate lyase activating enzyme